MTFIRVLLSISWLLRWILKPLVKAKPIQKNLVGHLELDPRTPVCYVFQTMSLADILVVEDIIEAYNLPRIDSDFKNVFKAGKSSFIFLAKPGILNVKKTRVGEKISELTSHVATTTEDIQLVPVSVFWGRNPGKESGGLMQAIFFDSRRGGVWQKILAIVLNGRQTVCSMGKPVSIRSIVDEENSVDQAAKKLFRLLRVHFNRQAQAALGPELYNREGVIRKVVRSDVVVSAIDELVEKKGMSREKAEEKAIKYVDEIASDLSFKTIFVFEKILTWLWQKVYSGVEVKNKHYLNDIKEAESVVYMPTHKSHMDYLLICYVLYNQGLTSPHTAAGINLNFWPAGSILRKAGAFFIRRSFRGDRLYATCFNEYLNHLINAGFPINFFPEGGRSRTGRLLQPKTGMLSMVINAQNRVKYKPITLVPVYISYDKIVEGKSYERELKGKSKKSENMGQLVKARKILRAKMGKAYVSFGKPQKLRDYLEVNYPEFSEKHIGDDRPKWISKAVSNLGHDMMARTNAAAIVSPVSVMCMMILSAPNRALTKEMFQGLRDIFYNWFTEAKYDDDIVIGHANFEDALEQAEELAGIETLTHPMGDIVYVSEKRALSLSYYSNSIIHLFVLPSFIAYLFIKKNRRKREDVKKICTLFYPFFKREFFLKWDDLALNDAIDVAVDFMVRHGMLISESDELVSPELAELNYTYLKTTAGILEPQFQYFGVGLSLIANLEKGVDLDEFGQQLNYLVDRMSLLSGDSLAFRTLGDYKQGYRSTLLGGEFLVRKEGYSKLVAADKLVEGRTLVDSLLDKGLKVSVKKVAASMDTPTAKNPSKEVREENTEESTKTSDE